MAGRLEGTQSYIQAASASRSQSRRRIEDMEMVGRLPLQAAKRGDEGVVKLLLDSFGKDRDRLKGQVRPGRRCRGPPGDGTKPSSSCCSVWPRPRSEGTESVQTLLSYISESEDEGVVSLLLDT